MCGIFGVITSQNSTINYKTTQKLVDELFILSESRGKESAGIAVKNEGDHTIQVLKKSIPATEFIKTRAYSDFIKNTVANSFKNQTLDKHLAIMAHARLVTNGSQENNNNNQPVIKDGMVAVHNGIITNVEQLWSENPELNRIYEVDTEVLLSMIRKNLSVGKQLVESVQSAYQQIKGTATTCLFLEDYNQIVLSSNNASLYYTYNLEKKIFIFASERYILNTAIEKHNLRSQFELCEVIWSKPFTGQVIDLTNFDRVEFSLKELNPEIHYEPSSIKDTIINHSPDKEIDLETVKKAASQQKLEDLENLLEFNLDAVNQLKRCSTCLLPETFPFIKFDQKGECNYCKRYVVKKQGEKEEEFKTLMKTYQSKDGKPDCIIPFSGGRDSSYGLHYIVKELGLHPITYTYDWGMVTDLARRNIARICGKLGIENIIVSADINMKRKNIRKNVEAWLKKPRLGMIPLFMAGDKQFFYYVNQIKKQTGIILDIWSTNILENTDFKVGFCGISPSFDKTRPDFLPLKSKVGLAWFYAKNFLSNPAYLNSSIKDTLSSFYSYYAAPRNHFYQLFDWIKWDEKLIEKTLFEEYDWEISPDTTTTWRIGDGTAAFYNYVYYTVAGFSEFDTFRSNQIREGLITREEGLAFINKENKPRFESMKWYFDTIGVDFEKAIKIVNKIPKLY